jgi:D-sedoheptulose 7-phosphate isomerase
LESFAQARDVLENLGRLETVVSQAADLLVSAYGAGQKSLFFGNGGSAADAQHLAAEFVGRFARPRRALAALALHANASALTAIANDYGYDHVFSRQIEAFGRPGDVAVAISTSGQSPNVISGVRTARQYGLHVVALTGRDGGQLAGLADVAIVVPSDTTARIQEMHILIGHILCDCVERSLPY